MYGIQRMEYLDDVLVLCGAGVGGGSHVYGNTLYVPPKAFFEAPEWAGITDWADELAPFIDQATPDARRRPHPLPCRPTSTGTCSRSRSTWATATRSTGRRSASTSARPGVEADDPYFGGVGPEAHRVHQLRQLHDRLRSQRQEQADHELPVPGRAPRRRRSTSCNEVYELNPLDGGGYRGPHPPSGLGAASGAPASPSVHGRAGHRRGPRVRLGEAAAPHEAPRPTDRVVRSARPAGPHELRAAAVAYPAVWRMEARPGEGPHHSGIGGDHLGGVARPQTSIEPVYYGVGSDVMSFLLTYHQHGEQKHPTQGYLKELVEHPSKMLADVDTRHWSERMAVMLCMQTTDTSIELYWKDDMLHSRHGQRHPAVGPHPGRRGVRRPPGQEDARPSRGAGVRGGQPHRVGALHRRDPDRRHPRTTASSIPTSACSASPVCT